MRMPFKLKGVKAFNDTIDGVKINYTKLIVEVPQKAVNAENQINAGFATIDIPFGEFTNCKKFKLDEATYPLDVELDIEVTTKGMTASDLTMVKPAVASAPQQRAA